MTIERVARILYTCVYLIVRRNPPLPSVETFLDTRLKDILAEPAPSDWPAFWREALASTVAEHFRQAGYRIDGFSPAFFENRNRKMRSVRDRIAEALMPLAARPTRASRKPRPATRRPPRRAGGGGACLLAILVLLGARLPTSLPLWPDALARAESPPVGSHALLERTPPDDPEAIDYRHRVRVTLRSDTGRRLEVPCSLLVEPAHYDLRPAGRPEQCVRIMRALPRGVGDREGHAPGVVLYADFDRHEHYLLSIKLPATLAQTIHVAAAADTVAGPVPGFTRFVRLLDRRLTGTLDLRHLDEAEHPDLVGVDFQAQLDLPVLHRRGLADIVRLQARADGMLAVRRSARRAHNALEVGLGLAWLRTFTLPGWGGGRRLHAFGLQLCPLGLESDQNFSVVDYTVGPALTCSIPWIEEVLLLWHRLIEMPRGFLPPTVRVAYTYVHRVRTDRPDPGDRQRVELELVAVAPLLRPLDLRVRHRLYLDLERDFRRSLTELSWKWYIGRSTRTALLLKVVHGALPPLLRHSSMASVGFAVGL